MQSACHLPPAAAAGLAPGIHAVTVNKWKQVRTRTFVAAQCDVIFVEFLGGPELLDANSVVHEYSSYDFEKVQSTRTPAERYDPFGFSAVVSLDR